MLVATLFACLLLAIAANDVSGVFAFHREANAPRPRPAGRHLAPDAVSLRHAVAFLAQKANYYWQLVTALVLLVPLHLRPKRTTDRDVALLLLNTTLAMWTSTRALPDGRRVVTLRCEGFAFPYPRECYDNRLHVEIEVTPRGPVGGDPHAFDAKVLRYDFNDLAIDSRNEMLSIFAIMISSVVHPIVHSFENEVYARHADPKLRAFDDFFLHGQYLNWCAWFWPGLFFRIGAGGHHWYRKVLAWNAELPLPVRHSANLVSIAPFSRSVRFLLNARAALFRVCKQHGLPMPTEALFVCTILHAVDHASCDRHTRGHDLRHEKLPNTGFHNLIALLFYRPAQHFWTNLLRDKQDRNPLYKALWTELCRIDRELAQDVTLSISY